VSRRLLAALLVVCVGALPVPAWTQQTQQPSEDESDLQPKFIWGILIKYAAGEAFSFFSRWMATKMNNKYALNISTESNSAMAMDIARLSISHFRGQKDTSDGATIEPNPTATPVTGAQAPATTAAAPATAVKVSEGGANYEGIHLAIVGATRDGAITELRPVKAGFRTGERFKLRAMATYSGLLVIENINPRGERRQIYPPSRGHVVMLPGGSDTLLPLGANEFFEFANATGEEQLVITLRDPRAVGGAASKAPVHRKDEEFGSHFVQPVAPSSYAVISESIRLQHLK
jgi:hypothetical protein